MQRNILCSIMYNCWKLFEEIILCLGKLSFLNSHQFDCKNLVVKNITQISC